MIISVINSKGGVGKTTLTLALAEALSARSERILAIDADGAQASLTERCARILSASELPFDVDASQEDEINDEEEAWAATLKRIKKALRQAPSYDHVILDGPPSHDRIQKAMIAASDFILVPVVTDAMSARAAKRIVAGVRDAAAKGKAIQAAMVLNMTDDRQLATQHAPDITAQHGIALLDTRLPRAAAIANADMQSRLVGYQNARFMAAVDTLIEELEL